MNMLEETNIATKVVRLEAALLEPLSNLLLRGDPRRSTTGVHFEFATAVQKIWSDENLSDEPEVRFDELETVRSFLNQRLHVAEMVPR